MYITLVEEDLEETYSLIYKSRQRLIFENESIKLDVFSMREE